MHKITKVFIRFPFGAAMLGVGVLAVVCVPAGFVLAGAAVATTFEAAAATAVGMIIASVLLWCVGIGELLFGFPEERQRG